MVLELRTVWSTGSGGTGYTVHHVLCNDDTITAADAGTIYGKFRTFWDAIKSVLPDNVTLSFEPEGRILNDGTGDLERVLGVSAPLQVNGTSTDVYHAGAGCRMDLLTGVVVGGRRLKGRMFIVPLGAGKFDTNGFVASSTQTTIAVAGANLIDQIAGVGSGNALAVWGRKTGTLASVSSVAVPIKGAILRGRRD